MVTAFCSLRLLQWSKKASAEEKRAEKVGEKNDDKTMEAALDKDGLENYPIEVRRGERIALTAGSEGFKPVTKTFIVQKKREIIFDFEKEKPRDPEKKTARRRRRKTTRKSAASRRTTRKPHRKGKKTRVGPGTMSMD